MKGWEELKEAFWAAVDAGPEERARRTAALAAIDPALPERLEALLAADARGESLEPMFEPEPASHPARIGGYDVIGVLGVGGMGNVYRARDSKLQRDVAIKVLPPSLTSDPDRLARFEREARVLASLSHRNIAQIHGLDESGGTPALVMELVPGRTLATVIAEYGGKPLPVSRVLTIVRQIADGLDAAHEKGIIHRDLKPGNVVLTEDGEVKILDFGVAKSLDDRAEMQGPAATRTGVVVGSPAYMSPEQARGLPVDKRADVWSFGCVLYELLTGRRAFAGETASDCVAAVLDSEPDMAVLPADTPASVRSLLRHCFEKDAKRRLRDVADARLAIDDALNPTREERSAPGVHDSRARVLGMRALALLTAVVVGGAAGMWAARARVPAATADHPRKVMASLVLPRGFRLSGNDLDAQVSESRFAISPDGRKLAVTAADGAGRVQLWLLDIGSSALQPIPHTEDGSFPFWSPDSASIAFVAGGKLKTVRLADGRVGTIAEPAFRIGAWGNGGQILFTPARSLPLHLVQASGGAPQAVMPLDTANGEAQHGLPAFLPDGRHFLYFSIGSRTGGPLDPRGIYLGSLDRPEASRLLIRGGAQARYANGHIVFVQSGRLMAQPFDLERNELHGAAAPLVEDVKLSTAGATVATAAFSVSDDGVLVYQSAPLTESRLVWFDRTGRQLLEQAAPADYGEVALSPDGARLAVSVIDPARSTRDLWLYDVASGRSQRLTFDPGDEIAPVWSPDGTRVLFSSVSGGLVDLKIEDVRTAAKPSALEVDSIGLGKFAADWSRDGRYIMYIGGGRVIARSDLWTAPMASPREARALLQSPFVETQGRFAPRGPWLAYVSNETGQLEVYVDRFPDLGAKHPVSTNGGRWPRWSHDGSELFYVSAQNQLMAVAARRTGDRIDFDIPRPLFTMRPRPPLRLDAYPYDVAPDGRRFVVNTLTADASANTITVVLGWAESLAKR